MKKTYPEDRSVYLYHPYSPQEAFTRPNPHCLLDVHEAQRVTLHDLDTAFAIVRFHLVGLRGSKSRVDATKLISAMEKLP
jgi:hypothetical protein